MKQCVTLNTTQALFRAEQLKVLCDLMLKFYLSGNSTFETKHTNRKKEKNPYLRILYF